MRALVLLSLIPSAALAATCDAATYPGEDWPTRSVADSRAVQIKSLEDYIFTLTGTDDERLGLRTDGLVIIKGGELIYERYARGYGASNPHISWSVAKSFSSALTGIAVQVGALKLEDSICKSLTLQTSKVCRIKVGDLLEFASGFDWQEEYEHSSYQASSVIAMLFGEGHRDLINFITGHRFYGTPGKDWRYSTADATLLSAVAKNALVPVVGADWAWTVLFDVLGMKGVVLEEDLLGTPQGGSHLFATPRDYARFGFLYLHDGCWNGARVLPDGWVKQSTTPSASFAATAPETEDTPNGRMWWLNQVSGKVKSKPWKDAPDDAYSAIGHWGQYVIVVPSADVVIVRTGDDRNDSVDLSKLISLALEVAK